MTQRTDNRNGFTVLEILLAFAILLVGAVSVYAIFARGLVSHKRAVDNTNAAILAGAVFDDIAANYSAWYYDRDRNGRPDRSEDRNENGVDDWFEPDAAGRLAAPIPYRFGYQYRIEYQRSQELDCTLFVTVTVYWRNRGVEKGEVFRRAVFIKDLPDLDP